MGNDGGSIPKRSDLTRTHRETRIKHRRQILKERVRSCALSNTPLRRPIVICRRGFLFNKVNLLESLMKHSLPTEFGHIRKLSDVRQITVDTSHSPNAEFPLSCPLTSKPVNGSNSFVLLWECGCLLYEKMTFSLSGVSVSMDRIKEIRRKEGVRAQILKKKYRCPNCGHSFRLKKLVGLNLSVGDEEGQAVETRYTNLRRFKEQRERKEKRKRREREREAGTVGNMLRRIREVGRDIEAEKDEMKIREGVRKILNCEVQKVNLGINRNKGGHVETKLGSDMKFRSRVKHENLDDIGNSRFTRALKRAKKLNPNVESECISESKIHISSNQNQNLTGVKIGKRGNLGQSEGPILKQAKRVKISNETENTQKIQKTIDKIEKIIDISIQKVGKSKTKSHPNFQIPEQTKISDQDPKSAQIANNLIQDRIETENENIITECPKRQKKLRPENSEFEKIIGRDKKVTGKCKIAKPKKRTEKGKSKVVRKGLNFGVPGPSEILKGLFHKEPEKRSAKDMAMNNLKHGLR